MKTTKVFLLFFLLLSFNASIAGQSILIDDTFRESEVLDIKSVGPNAYVIALRSTYANGTKVLWMQDGVEHKSFIIRDVVASLRIHVGLDGVTIEASSVSNCDVYYARYNEILFDTVSVDEVWLAHRPDLHQHLPDIARTRDESLVVLQGFYRRLTVTKADEVLISMDLPSEDIESIKETDNHVFIYGGQYVFFYEKGVYQLDTVVFEGGNVLDVELSDRDSVFAVLTDSGIYERGFNSKAFVNEYPLYAGNASPKDFIYTDQLYLLRSYEEQLNAVEVIDEEGNWQPHQSQHQVNNWYDLNQLFDMGADGIWLAGQFVIEHSERDPYRGSAIVLKLDNEIEPQNDISLEDVSVEGDGQTMVNISFTVANNSGSDLEKIRVFSTAFDGIWCSSTNLDYTIARLAANSDTTINTSVWLYSNKFVGNACLYILGSETNPDLEMEDNVTCLQVTSTENIIVKEVDNVFPNPASSVVYVEKAKSHDRIMVFNSNGKVMINQHYQNGVDVSGIAPGLYFLRNATSQSTGAKFIKE